MTNKCAVCQKWSKKGYGRSFHRFPSDIERKGLWARQLKLNFVGKWSYVCSDHFQEADFKVKPSGVRVLKSDAVPCLSEAFRTQTSPSLALANSIKREEDHNRAFDVEDVQDVPAFVVVTSQAASIENRSFKVDDVNLPSNELNGDFLSSSIDIKSEDETSGSSTDSVDLETCALPLSIKEELDPQTIENAEYGSPANHIVRRFSSTDIENDDEFSEPKLKIMRQSLTEENAVKMLTKESTEPMLNESQASGSRTQGCFETYLPKNVLPQMLIAESPNPTAESMSAKQTIKSPFKKRLRKGHLDAKMKETILNTYKIGLSDNPTMLLDDVAAIVASGIGVSSRSVRRVISEYKKFGALSEPKTNQNRKKTFDSLLDIDKSAIRRKVHDFFFRNELPTLEKVLRAVNEDPDLPSFKKTTFYKILKKLNFKFGKRERNSFLTDRDDIKCWRRDYLTKIKAFRNENRTIYYLDETSVNADGLYAGLKNPSGKAQRLIVCHIGSENGFLSGGLWTFLSKKGGDCHEEMDGPSFEKWFAHILPSLEDNSVIVLENAPYHSRKLEKIPNTSSKKGEIHEWLRSKNIPFEDDMIKAQLLRLVNEHKKQFTKYVLDEMARAQNKTVLRLPPYHCELNPIELIWADVKNFVADRNSTFKFADVQNIFQEAVSNVTPHKWKKCVEHVQQKVEIKMWKLDNIMDEEVEPLVKRVGESSSTSSSDIDTE